MPRCLGSLIAASILVGGCSARSQTSRPVDSGVETPGVQRSGYAYTVRLDNGGVRSDFTVVGTAEQIFAIVAEVYESLSIPIETIDHSAMLIGNPHHVARRRFAGERMSKFFNCGTGPWGSNADSYRIAMSLLTRLTPANPGSISVQTTLDATGSTMSGASKNEVACTSTGRLEQLIKQRIMGRLAAR